MEFAATQETKIGFEWCIHAWDAVRIFAQNFSQHSQLMVTNSVCIAGAIRAYYVDILVRKTYDTTCKFALDQLYIAKQALKL